MDKITEDTLMIGFDFAPDDTPLLVVGRVEKNNTVRVINIIDNGEEVLKLYKKLTTSNSPYKKVNDDEMRKRMEKGLDFDGDWDDFF